MAARTRGCVAFRNTQSGGLLRPRLGGESVCSGSGSEPWRAPEQNHTTCLMTDLIQAHKYSQVVGGLRNIVGHIGINAWWPGAVWQR